MEHCRIGLHVHLSLPTAKSHIAAIVLYILHNDTVYPMYAITSR